MRPQIKSIICEKKSKSWFRKIQEKRIFGQINTCWEYIEEWIFYNNFTCFIRHFIRFIKRLPKWIKVAWNQEDWDVGYLYDLIELKLKEFLKAQEEDTWHDTYTVKHCIKQIKITLARLDRYRNWPNYYDYPMDDIVWVDCEDGCKMMKHTSEENEKQRLGADKFEQHNYDKFWKDFLKWHQNWWT